MSEYNKKLDMLVDLMQIADNTIGAAQGTLGDHLDHLVREIHALENGNIKEPMHVLHWRMGLHTMQALHDARTSLQETIRIYTKNR